jgi:ApaG protein
MSDTTTRGIRVQVQSAYVPERSAPTEGEYFFAYTVRISNQGSESAKLVSRHWIISGPEGVVGEVEGPGVVGEQPLLAPGGSFQYTSFCPLRPPSARCTAPTAWSVPPARASTPPSHPSPSRLPAR